MKNCLTRKWLYGLKGGKIWWINIFTFFEKNMPSASHSVREIIFKKKNELTTVKIGAF